VRGRADLERKAHVDRIGRTDLVCQLLGHGLDVAGNRARVSLDVGVLQRFAVASSHLGGIGLDLMLTHPCTKRSIGRGRRGDAGPGSIINRAPIRPTEVNGSWPRPAASLQDTSKQPAPAPAEPPGAPASIAAQISNSTVGAGKELETASCYLMSKTWCGT
jgi:hypothetical protein